MKRALKLALFVGLAVIGASLAGVTPAFADTIHVHPGDSIQKAVNKANPGDTIVVDAGVYEQSVLIKKDDLSLKGAGSDTSGTVLVPAPTATGLCAKNQIGVCVINPKGGTVSGNRITGFRVEGFGAFGFFAQGSSNNTWDHDAAVGDGEYGFVSFDSSGNKYLHNLATGAGEAGFYYGDSDQANGYYQDNVAQDNQFGFFLRDSAHGTLWRNQATANCDGFMFLDTDAPVVGGNWNAVNNVSSRNNKFCPASEGGPALSGIGMAILGDENVTLYANTVDFNIPQPGFQAQPGMPPPLAGGIVLLSSKQFGGGPENGNVIRGNSLNGNQPFDIAWDKKGTGNTFVHNECTTSQPGGLCS